MSHVDHELLSAYLDGEVSSTDRAHVDGHVVACGTCVDALEDLRFAAEQVRGLSAPDMPELHRKQLWREINRARRAPATRWRALVAVGGTAASILAFAGLTMLGGQQAADVATGAVQIERSNQEWSRAAMDELAGSVSFDSAGQLLSAPGDATTAAEATPTTESEDSVTVLDARGERATRIENHGAQIAQCEIVIRPGGDDGARAVRYIIGRYDGMPAYILVYDVPRDDPTSREVYAVQRLDCRVLAHRSG